MYNTFEFVGKISPVKDTEKFKAFDEKTYDSGWTTREFKFNMVCGTNRHLISIKDGTWKDEKKGKIYTYSKATVDNDGNKKDGEKLEIPFSKRFDENYVAKVAEYRKFIVDLELPGKRYRLEKAIDKFKDGTITDEQMNEIGCHTIEEVEKALAESQKKRKEFLTAWDMAEYMQKVANSDKIKDKLFKISGNYEIQYSAKNDKYYRTFAPNRVYLASEDEMSISSANLDLFFDKNALDDSDFADTKKYHVNAKLRFYDGTYKGNFGCPITLTIDGNGDEKKQKLAEGLKKKFAFPDDCEAEWRELGVKVDILDGVQRVELSEDMLTDEQRENIECGLITMEDIVKELGGNIYGDRVQDIVITGLARGFSKGSVDTVYVGKDFVAPHPLNAAQDNDDDILSDDDLDI